MRRLAIAALGGLVVISSGRAEAQTERDKGVKVARAVGVPGGSSPVDMSRPGFDAVLESTAGDTDVSIHVGAKKNAWSFDATLKSDVDKNDKLSKVIAADREPLSSSGSFSAGVTYESGLEFESDAVRMLAVCGSLTPCATNNTDLPDDVREKLRSMITFKAARTFGLKVTVTRPSFAYRPTANGTDVEDERHTGTAVTGGAGFLWNKWFYTGASAGYEHAWKAAGDPVSLCEAVAGSPTVSQCVETVIGVPLDNEGTVFAAVARIFADRFIIAPRFEYRETKNVKAFDVPVYFIPESDGPKLTGGVAYRLKNGDSSIFAFVGTAVPGFGLP
jgi:hypothetical protein